MFFGSADIFVNNTQRHPTFIEGHSQLSEESGFTMIMNIADIELIDQVLAGSKDAFGELAQRHSPRCFEVIFRIVRDRSEADDIMQDVLVKAYKNLNKFKRQSEFGTWIYRIAMNSALTAVSKRRTSPDEGLSAAEVGEKQLRCSSPNPERDLLSRELASRQEMAFRRLSPSERIAFSLRHLDGRSIHEISSELGTGSHATKQAIYRAVKKLRCALQDLRA